IGGVGALLGRREEKRDRECDREQEQQAERFHRSPPVQADEVTLRSSSSERPANVRPRPADAVHFGLIRPSRYNRRAPRRETPAERRARRREDRAFGVATGIDAYELNPDSLLEHGRRRLGGT